MWLEQASSAVCPSGEHLQLGPGKLPGSVSVDALRAGGGGGKTPQLILVSPGQGRAPLNVGSALWRPASCFQDGAAPGLRPALPASAAGPAEGAAGLLGALSLREGNRTWALCPSWAQ